MTCTQQRLDRRPANPVLSGDVTLDGRDEHGLQSTIHCLRGSMDSRRKTYSKTRVLSSPRLAWPFSSRLRRLRARRTRRSLVGPWAMVQTVSFPPGLLVGPGQRGRRSTTSCSRRTRTLQLAGVLAPGHEEHACQLPTRPCRTERIGGAYRRSTRTATRRRWSAPRSIEKLWADSPTLTSPDDDAIISFPDEPLVLRWDPVPGAAKYSVEIANDLGLSSLVTSGGNPVVIQATNLAPALLLPSNMYFWAVTPLDAQGNPGERPRSAHSPGTGHRRPRRQVTDLAAETELYDPEVHVGSCPGAARYEVEVNSSSDFASRIEGLLHADKPIATTLSPQEVFVEQHVLLARSRDQRAARCRRLERRPVIRQDVRQLPASWTNPRSRTCACATRADPGTDTDCGTPGYQTELPIVTWDPVPGASSYQVNVGPVRRRACRITCICDRSVDSRAGSSTTASPHGLRSAAGTELHAVPFRQKAPVEGQPGARRPAEPYCVQVQARSGRVNLSQRDLGRLHLSRRRHRRLVHVHRLPERRSMLTRSATPTTSARTTTCCRLRGETVRRPTHCSSGTRSQASSPTG